MALRSGIDTVAIVSNGNYTETYVSSTGGGNIASLYATKGYLEDAPNLSVVAPTSTIYGPLFGPLAGPV